MRGSGDMLADRPPPSAAVAADDGLTAVGVAVVVIKPFVPVSCDEVTAGVVGDLNPATNDIGA
jgi:hypothetical protein